MSLREQFEAWAKKHKPVMWGFENETAWDAFQAGHAVNADLLEACEALLKIGNESEPFTDAGMWEYKLRRREVEDMARAAIKKARGET